MIEQDKYLLVIVGCLFVGSLLTVPLIGYLARSVMQQRKVTASRLAAVEASQARLHNELEAKEATDSEREHENPLDGIPLMVGGLRRALRSMDLELTRYVTLEEAAGVVRALIASGAFIEALPWLRDHKRILGLLSLNELRSLYKFCRRTGYLTASVDVIQQIAADYQKESDVHAALMARSELSLYQGFQATIDSKIPAQWEADNQTILHLVGKVLPHTQSGYTLRTHYTARAQKELRLNPVVVRHAGGDDSAHHLTEMYEHDGITYYALGGPIRGSIPWDEWLQMNSERLFEIASLLKPSAIHVHSDFINFSIAKPVATTFGIPIINEVRGFWEETWLSRVAIRENWGDLEAIERDYGLPDMYTMRRECEARARNESDVVITLATVMRSHIEQTAEKLGINSAPIEVVPNAVEAATFIGSKESRRFKLATADSSQKESITVGYLGSLVDYEGVDLLIKAWFLIEAACNASLQQEHLGTTVQQAGLLQSAVEEADLRVELPRDLRAYEELLLAVGAIKGVSLRLRIIGGGPEYSALASMRERLGVSSIELSGRVPHDEIPAIYGDLDLVVIPRKRTSVTELVTPLKPFEAMAAGVPCLVSNLEPLREVFGASRGGSTFAPGDVVDLAIRIAQKVSSPEALVVEGLESSNWVTEHRSWANNARKYNEIYAKSQR